MLPPYEKRLLPWSGGLNTAVEPSAIGDDELTVAKGCEYHLGNPHLHKQPGRVVCATLPGANQVVRAVQHLQYDGVASVLAAYGGDGALYESAVTLAPTFSSSGLVVDGDAIPHFNSYNDLWIMCNGSDSNMVRETAVPPGNTGYSGHWRPGGMQPAIGQPVISTVAAAVATTIDERSWTSAVTSGAGYAAFGNPQYAYDITDDPNYYATFADGVRHKTQEYVSHTWAYNTSVVNAGTDYVIEINFYYDVLASVVSLTYALDGSGGVNTGTFQATSLTTAGGAITPTTLRIPIPATCTNLNKVRVRANISTVAPGNTRVDVFRIFDLRILNVNTTGTGAIITEDPVQWLVTERFYDADGILHESVGNTPSAPQTFASPGIYSAKVYLPGMVLDSSGSITGTVVRNNATTTEFVIYRSIAEPGGGYPLMWELNGTIPWTSTNGGGGTVTYYNDTFAQTIDTLEDKTHLYDTIKVLYPTGEVLYFALNSPPPRSTMSLSYQSAILYFPVDEARKVYYSIPTTLSNAAAEQVPAVYSLNFLTPQNDSATSGVVTNGGRSCIIYFPSYAMLVNYLPQANDPGVFDARVREFVSEVRGASGRFCATSVSLPSGGQLAVAVDQLGIWATDGVSGVADWSRDLGWTTNNRDGLMDGVDLFTAQLRDNSEMRRLELLYTDTAGDKQEMHVFYGEMKEGNVPKVTGPHPAGDGTSLTGGWISAHYTFADTTSKQWLGWKGSGYTDGKVYLERIDTSGDAVYSDAAHAYNAVGDIPWIATNGYPYISGLGQACIIEVAVPKFETTPEKDFTITGSFKRDGSSGVVSVEKTYEANSDDTKVYWHRYCDRHQLSIEDISNTRSPALIAYQLYYRESGLSKEGE